MVSFLAFLTTVVNLIGLAITLCLGLYIVTRTPGSRLSWLAALVLWACSCFYLHNTMALHVPDSGVLPWLRPMVMLALPLGFHLVLLLPPGKEPGRLDFFLPPLQIPETVRRGLGSVYPKLSRSVVPLAYGLALALTLGGVFPFPLAVPAEGTASPGVFLSDQSGGPLHPLSIAYLCLLCSLALLHLWQSRKHSTAGRADQAWALASLRYRRRYTPLLAAVLLTFLGGIYLALGISLQLPLPSFPGDLAVGIAVLTVGYLVARHNARVEGVPLHRDLLYIALVVGSFTIFYIVIAEILYIGGHIFSPLTLILIILVAISTLMLYDGLRTTVDRLLYREQFQQLRSNLRALAREAGLGQSLPDRLHAILNALCRTLYLRGGFIAVRRGDVFVCEATAAAPPTAGEAPAQAVAPGQAFTGGTLSTAEMADLPQPGAEELEGMALLVPLYDGEDQIGALVLGPKESGRPYGEGQRILMEDLADQLVAVIQATRQQEENARRINDMVTEFRERERTLQRQMETLLVEHEEEQRPVLQGIAEEELVSLVEDALRQLYDYPYLGEHPLSRLGVVDWGLKRQDEEFVTHIDRGKALSEILVQAMNKLRPDGAEPGPHAVPPREWYQYLILHDAYLLGELNRDIMSKLYISEGTFNRTRRRAVRGVARALQDMEREAQLRMTE